MYVRFCALLRTVRHFGGDRQSSPVVQNVITNGSSNKFPSNTCHTYETYEPYGSLNCLAPKTHIAFEMPVDSTLDYAVRSGLKHWASPSLKAIPVST